MEVLPPSSTPNHSKTLEETKGNENHKLKKKDLVTTTSPRVTPPYVVCDVMSHPTNYFPALNELKVFLHAPKVPILLSPPPREKPIMSHNKILCTNHPCAICEQHGHYMHHCLDLPRYRDVLADLRHTIIVAAPLPPTSDADDM